MREVTGKEGKVNSVFEAQARRAGQSQVTSCRYVALRIAERKLEKVASGAVPQLRTQGTSCPGDPVMV